MDDRLARRRPCPVPKYDQADADGQPVYYLVLPEEWTGEHAQRRDEAVQRGEEQGLGGTLLNFAVAMALLEDWHLPGLGGNPEQWQLQKVSLPVIAWVSQEVLTAFAACFIVPKAPSRLWQNGRVTAATFESAAPGNSPSATP